MVKVLDASAIVLFFEKKSGYDQIRQLFLDSSQNKCDLLITSVNWGEVRYVLNYKMGKTDPQGVEQIMDSLPVRLVDVNREIVTVAGDLKIKYKIAYCDAIAAGLAKLQRCEFVTSDSDFNVLKNEIKLNLINSI